MEGLCTAGVVITAVLSWVSVSDASHWRERSQYPKSHDDFEIYVTDNSRPVTGERAMTVGCGAEGRPYKYRGKKHVTELTNAMSRLQGKRVWVGAVDATTPWVWTNGHYLFHLVGVVSSSEVSEDAVRLPGNNAFLCSLQCGQVSFVLLQGTKCACLKTRPKVLPVSGKLLRCPGTFAEYCGTSSAFTVYKNMLAKTVKWGRLVDKARYHGNKAYLYRSPLSDHPLVSLRAEEDPADRKGYICNSTVLSIGPKHLQHLWVAHAQTAAMTWQEALVACMNEGRQLMMLPRDAKACVQEVESNLQKGQSYWVGLSRRNEALWLDGSPVRTSVSSHHKGQAGCLTMSLTSKTPTFTFESCTGLVLPILCERNGKRRLHAFTHDGRGNHIITHRESDHLNDYSDTISVLVAVLVILTLLSIALLLLLYHRDKWIPRKPSSTHNSSGNRASKGRTPTSNAGFQNTEKADTAVSGISNKNDLHFSNQHVITHEQHHHRHHHNDLNYNPAAAAANKGQQPRYTSTRTANIRPTSSSSMDYTEVCLPEEIEDNVLKEQGVRVSTIRKSQTVPTGLNTGRKQSSSVRVLDYLMDSSRSSVTGSDEAYSILGYRKSIQSAWTNVRGMSYNHVMINRPMKSGDDQSMLYDIAQVKPPPVRCIDHDYDHTDPGMTMARSLSEPHDVRSLLKAPIRRNDSDV